MSMRRRKELIEVARTRKAVIIEDDYDGEFRHEGGALEALCMRDAADVTFYVGTFSKSMLWSLRLGFVVAPKWAVSTLAIAKSCLDFQSPGPIQLGVASFITEGHLARHVRKMRRIYKERRELLLAILRSEMAEWLRPVASHYGVHVCALDHAGLNMRSVVEAAAEEGVMVHSLNRYYYGQETRSGLVIGYGIADLAEIKRGLAILRNVLKSIRSP
jgi:GntR family transcriptional regulator/MocR family aminotransferase